MIGLGHSATGREVQRTQAVVDIDGAWRGVMGKRSDSGYERNLSTATTMNFLAYGTNILGWGKTKTQKTPDRITVASALLNNI